MKIEFSVNQPSRGRSQAESIILPKYYGVEEVIADLQKVLDYHTFKHEKQKLEFIKMYGQENWDRHIEEEKNV